MAAYAIDHNGNVHMIFYCPAIEDHIRYRELMDYIFSELLEMHGDIEKIHLHYIPQDEYDPLKTEYLYLEFDLPEIKYVQEGKPVEPGTITWLNDPNDRAKKSYTLRGGASLEPDCYYLLSSRPRDTFETKDEPLFWFSVPEETEVYQDSHWMQRNETPYLRRFTITGNRLTGFVIHITPPSEGVFKVVEVDE